MFTHLFQWKIKRTCNTILALFDEIRDNVKKKAMENNVTKNQQPCVQWF